jgi:hypothetical protein
MPLRKVSHAIFRLSNRLLPYLTEWGRRAMPHRKYRALERECRRQAHLTVHERTKEELEKMAREYKAIADWLERRHQAGEQWSAKE